MNDKITEFRALFTEFADEEKFPDSVIAFWCGIAENLTSADRFGALYQQALYLFTAHKLALWWSAQKAAQVDNYGRTDGDVIAKRVGDVSVNFANAGDASEGELSTTTYGRAYLDLCKALCFGCVQL